MQFYLIVGLAASFAVASPMMTSSQGTINAVDDTTPFINTYVPGDATNSIGSGLPSNLGTTDTKPNLVFKKKVRAYFTISSTEEVDLIAVPASESNGVQSYNVEGVLHGSAQSIWRDKGQKMKFSLISKPDDQFAYAVVQKNMDKSTTIMYLGDNGNQLEVSPSIEPLLFRQPADINNPTFGVNKNPDTEKYQISHVPDGGYTLNFKKLEKSKKNGKSKKNKKLSRETAGVSLENLDLAQSADSQTHSA